MTEPILYDNMEKAPTESNLSITSNDINIELSKEFLVELRKIIYHETYNEDVVDHIAKNGGLVMEMEKSPLGRNLLRRSSVDSIPNHTMEKMKCWTKNWNKRRMDDSILSSNNTTTDSFFKPYLITCGKSETKKEDEQSQTKRKYSNTSNPIDEQPNKRMYKEEKFEAIKYSLGSNEEYIAIRGYEFDIWEKNEDNLSIIYQDIF
ncbi:hypothetical protein Tco_0513284 [Tanacetum coccineum]